MTVRSFCGISTQVIECSGRLGVEISGEAGKARNSL
jgi:hypothetical protein